MNFQDKTREELIKALEELLKENDSLKTALAKNKADVKGSVNIGISDEELLQIREKAEESELQIKLIADNLTNGMIYQAVAIDENQRLFTYVSDTVKKFYGCTPEEAKADASLIYSRIYEEDAPKLAEEEKKAMKNMSVFNTEARVVAPNGEIRWSYFVSSPRLYKGVVYWDGIEIDITDRKKIEKEREEMLQQVSLALSEAAQSKKVLNEIMERMSDGIIAFDKDFNYTYVNSKGAELLGRKSEDLIGKNHWAEYPEAKETSFASIYLKAMETQQILKLEEYYANWDRWFVNHIYPSKEGITIFFADITQRKKTEEELIKAKETAEENELKYKQLFDNTLDYIFILEITEDGRFKVLAVNPAQEKEIGVLRSGTFVEDFVPEEVSRNFINNYQRCISEGKPIAYEENFYNRDFYTQLIPIRNAKGNIYRILGIAREITTEKKFQNQLIIQNEVLKNLNKELTEAKEILSESETKFRNLFENSPVGISITNIDGHIYINKAFCKMLGYIEGEFDPKKWMDITYVEDIALTQEIIQSLLSGKARSARFEKRYVHKNGNIIWTEVSTFLQLDKKNKPQFFLSSILDITERKKAEDAIKQEGILLRTLINNLSDAIYVKDKEGRKLVANTADMSIMKCSSEAEIIGKTDLEIFNSEDGAKGFAEDIEVIKTGKALIDHEDGFVDEEGKQHWRLTSKVPLFNEQNQVIGLVGFGRDITERKKNEELLIQSKEKAEESDRLKTAFLHNISHEIRTPMNAIIGFSSLLNEPNVDPEKRQYFIDIITQSSNQLLSIITDIINIANIETGQEETTESIINVGEVVKKIYEQFLLTAENRENSLNLVIPSASEDITRIITDETKLTQILSNLLVNALKFTKQGVVNLGYEVKHNEIEFFVEDTGIGIAPQMHEEIFKRFRQIETSFSRQYGGSGLGLSISKAYVEMLGGRIWLKSEIGLGSTFYFTIPYKKYEGDITPQEQPALSADIKGSLVKILLVAEDEESNFMFLKELLTELNFKIIWARNGLEAVELSKSESHIDLVLMDMKMPIMNGYEAAKQIKELLPDLPVIALTAYSDNEDRERALAFGCNDLIGKPFKKELLMAKIYEHIHKKT